jgi:putative spermidine/putrescine transport system ATP-binding protein
MRFARSRSAAHLNGKAAAGGAVGGAKVELFGLRRRFGATLALDGLTLSIEPGEFVALLGPSGCGKTTALRALAGFETLDAGRIVVDGQDLAGVPAQRRDMGMVFQSYSLFPNLNSLDNVAFGLRMRGVPAALRREKAASVLDLVGLASETEKYPHQMSGGQQQRVALARALAIEPRVLLLDEPLSALDAKVRLQLRDQIKLLQTRLAITTLFVTHDQEEALSMANRVCVMRSGRIEQVDAPSVLYSTPATPFVAEFVGIMNRIPGRIAAGGVEVLGAVAGIRNAGSNALGSTVEVLVRPEGLTLAAAEHGHAIVMTKTFLGATTRVTVLLEGELTVQVDRPSDDSASLDPGAPVEVRLLDREVLIAEGGPAAGAPAGARVTASSPN